MEGFIFYEFEWGFELKQNAKHFNEPTIWLMAEAFLARRARKESFYPNLLFLL